MRGALDLNVNCVMSLKSRSAPCRGLSQRDLPKKMFTRGSSINDVARKPCARSNWLSVELSCLFAKEIEVQQ